MDGTRGLAVLVVLLLASALLPSPTSGSGRRVLEGGKSRSSEDAPAPTVPEGGSPKRDSPQESGQSAAASSPPPPKDKEPSAGKGNEGSGAQASTSPPPPQVQETVSPPPGGLVPNSGGEAKSGMDGEDTESQGKEKTDKMKETMEKCDSSHKCSGKDFSACLQVSDNASDRSIIIVQNEGQNEINVNIKKPSNISIDKRPLQLAKGAFGQMNITFTSGNITLDDGNGGCFIHFSKSVFDWQQQFQMFATNPIYGASFFVFTVVLVGAVCACCKFGRRRGNDGVPYQQLELGAQAPSSSVVDNTTSTTDGWEDGWDDDWDDEEAPATARPSDKKPTSSVSANGLSLRSQTNGKDGWDVDWDD